MKMIRVKFRIFLSLFLLIFISWSFLNAIASGKDLIQIKGSDTEINLVQRLTEVFMKENPSIRIAVTGGGSGTGIAALINKRTDIANSSREMKEEEIKQAKEKGVNPTPFVVSLDALAIITHGDNPVDSLTLAQLGQIFRGEISDWKDIGTLTGKISTYGRQSNSGTFIYFRDVVLKGDYSPHVKRMNGNAQIVEAVKRDKAGIGYVGHGYVVDKEGKAAPGVKVISLSREMGGTPVSPLVLINITTNRYPLVRPLFQYTNGQPQGDLRQFIEFELSPKGQEVIGNEGFFPVGPEQMAQNKRLLGGK